jgi:flagellar motor switch protein FliN/FliY
MKERPLSEDQTIEPDGVDAPPGEASNLDAILSIPVTVQVVLGTTSMPVARLMKLGRGAVITLDQKVGAPVNVLVNGRVVARGEVVVVDEDNSRFGVSLTEIISSVRDARLI